MNDDLHDHGLGDLGAQLDAAASTVHAEPDVEDLRRRLGHQRRVRGTAMAAVAAIAVVASVAVWQSGDQPVSVASSADPSTTRPADASASGSDAASTRTTGEGLLVSVARTDGALVPSTPWWTPPESCRGPRLPVVSVTDPTTGGKEASSATFVTLGQTEEALTVDASLVYVGAPLEVATTEDGAFTTSTAVGATSETITGAVTITPNGGVEGATPLTAGGAGSLPEPDAWVATLAVSGDDVRHAEVTFINGTVDEADAVDGMVGLAARYPDGPTHLTTGLITRVEITRDHGDPIVLTELDSTHAGFDAAGAALGTTTSIPSVTTISPVPVSGECTAPPAPLPAPGEQPADATAAQAAVTSAVTAFMDGSKPEAEREAAMQDPAHGQRVQQELGAGYAAAMTSARTTVKDVVFVSPTTAIVRYDLDVTPTGTEPLPIPKDMFHDSIAKVVFEDGRWVVTPQSLCKITSVATPNACAGMTSNYPDEVYGPGGSAS